MDNPLTPKKIKRLMYLAEDNSFNPDRSNVHVDEDFISLVTKTAMSSKVSVPIRDSSSGILDLERMEGFGESGLSNLSLSKSTAFNPGELTGRSTGAEDGSALAPASKSDVGRYSLGINNLITRMDKQTSEVNDIIRHSIATNYSFHSKRDLTADEMSLIAREAPLPVQVSTYHNITENIDNTGNQSVGAYFKHRCPEFNHILQQTDSPVRPSMVASITEVSSSTKFDGGIDTNKAFSVDDSLDSIPVRQPRNNDTLSIPGPPSIKPTRVLEQKTQIQMPKDVEKKVENISKIPVNTKTLKYNSGLLGQKSFMSSSKPADMLLKNLHSSIRLMNEDTEASIENSLSISKIADYLGKQSNVSITDMMQLNQKKSKNTPLTELDRNTQKKQIEDIQVTKLIDTKKTEVANSASTIDTVICLDKLNFNDPRIPEVVVSEVSSDNDVKIMQDDFKSKRRTRSKSPSSKSQSTLSTIRENHASLVDSPVQLNEDMGNISKVPSPNSQYRELDMSVDWQDVLKEKLMKQERLVKEKWAVVSTTLVEGFVGVNTAVPISITILTDSWLTAKFQFDNLPNDGRDINYELPRLPLLLSPKKSENFTLYITSKIEMNTTLPFTIYLKDTSVDGDIAIKEDLHVNFKMPVIQAMSIDGINKVTFPKIHGKGSHTKSFVLISDCQVDLQLELSIIEGDTAFSIRGIQEIRKSDVNKMLLDNQTNKEDQIAKSKVKTTKKQLCRLTSGNAIKVSLTFSAPKLTDAKPAQQDATFSGVLNVKLFDVNTVLRRVELVGAVGSANLALNVPSNKISLLKDSTTVSVSNTGSIGGVWCVKFGTNKNKLPFEITPTRFELNPGEVKIMTITHVGPDDGITEMKVLFEDVATGAATTLEVTGGGDKIKSFPIKTTHQYKSWVRGGRKDVSLKNDLDKKVYVRCQILGEGFSIDLPGVESRGIILPFSAEERRLLPIVFAPTSNLPCTATLHLVLDKNTAYSRKIKLFGCAGGELVRWSGLVTYGDTALVRAISRAPVDLKLYNKSAMPAFVCARVQFNLQYMCAEERCTVGGARSIVPARAHHVVSLHVDWTRVERRARAGGGTAFATVSVLTGPEVTRRRILKILKEAAGGTEQFDTSLLPNHLKVLTDHFENEDDTIDKYLTGFSEGKSSLDDLIGGMQELTAQIDLPQDFTDENSTIIITDDTMLDHHTICD